jgi:hypothetical protein
VVAPPEQQFLLVGSIPPPPGGPLVEPFNMWSAQELVRVFF